MIGPGSKSGRLRLIGIALAAVFVGPVALAQDTPARDEPREGAVPATIEEDDTGEETEAQGETSAAGEAGSAEGAGSAAGEAGSAEGAGSAEAPTSADPGAVPWAGTKDVPLPAFLDTTDTRIEDDRPPPSETQVAALLEMEAEVERFFQTGSSYKETVSSLLRREYQRQRRSRDQWYARQIRAEEGLLDESRENAIRLFERFIRNYPDDPTYTPDAMFRLGELYFERSSIQFQEAYSAARDSGETDSIPLTPDFTPTVDLYKRLVRSFPDYRRLDGVYYLIGYCLQEMGEPEEARLAWLNLVCANEFTYDPDRPTPGPEEPADEREQADEEFAEQHPAMTLDGEAEAEPGVFVDPYDECDLVIDDARFVSETWFRIGEYHFDDYGDPHSLDLAISAYQNILKDPEDRNYNLALYKVAWAYYRDNRYPEAIEHFGKLVQWSDDQELETGRAGSELRPEAVQYLGIAFAYDDWNENLVPDEQEGMPRPIERVQDASLLPQDRDWTAEVYFQLGQVLFDEAKYEQAIEVWTLALSRWPNHHRAPEIQNMVARAHQEHKEFEAAIAARAELGNYIEGSDWWDANRDRPAEQREAERLAENALIGSAIHYHQQAQQLRRQCVAQQDLTLCEQAQESYDLAADGYRTYLEKYPNNPQAYELQYNLADALYWSEQYEEAARQYAAVRDSNLDDSHLVEAARRVVESLARIVDAAKEGGSLTVRDEPPEPHGEPLRVDPIEMPELLQRLAQAREVYLARVPEARDTENVREAYDFNNALLLYQYGFWAHAIERFNRIFDERCKGALADETGQVAWLNLRNIAVSLGNTDEVEGLARKLQEKQCTFSASGEQAVPPSDCESAELRQFCADPANERSPRCLVCEDLGNICYKRAIDETYKPAESAAGQRQRQLYEQAATKLVQCVNAEPNHPDAPIALEMAATALERTSRFESAAQLYQRIIDEVGPRDPETPAEQKKLDEILGNAYFRLAYNANRFFDFDRAVDNYRLLADSTRFRDASGDQIQKWREDALINAAIILENLQRYDEASRYYERAATMVSDPEAKQKSYYRVAEIAYKQRSYGEAIRKMRDFISRYQRDSDAGELVVQAHWRIAQMRKSGRESEYRAALADVVRAFERSGEEPGSIAAEYAAQAAFELANDPEVARFEGFEIDPGRPANMEAYVNAITRQINEGSERAKTLAEKFNEVPGFRRPTWTIAGFVRQGRIYEVLARAILNTPVVLPRDMQQQLRRVSAEQRDEIKWQIEDRVRQVLDAKVRPVECLGVARYALAARAARAGSIDNEHTRSAVDRLQAYGDERIAECIEQARAEDASFGAYQTGEFSRAPRGQNREPAQDSGPPPLVGGS